ncbi:hypothetical protein [Prauserella flavalba]|uniref:hypothetical protein n=1 Tax=Prauserella flavalba TaxID=1477506 RepID=UPI000D770B08|nr:hypothetical protein [Prauserella flavalba]
MKLARVLTGAGLLGCLVWSVLVEAAMPSWFDLDDSCPGATGVERRYFPPSATCLYEGGRAVGYLPLFETVVLTVAIVLLAAVTVTGLVLLWRQAPAKPLDQHPKRPFLHVLGAAALGIVTAAVGRTVVIIALLLGGPPGGITALLVVALGAVGVASALDRAAGPGGGVSGRRATALVVVGGSAMFALLLATRDTYAREHTLLGPGWAIAAAGGAFALAAGAQWLSRSLSPRP